MARHLADVGEHPRRGRLAVGAGHCGNRHRSRGAGREEHIDDRARDIARSPFTGRAVHSEAGRRVHLADSAAVLAVRLRDVGSEEVHTADVQSNRLDGAHRHLGVVRVDDVGDVGRGAAGGEIARGAERDNLPGGGHAFRRVASLSEQTLGLRVEREAREHLLVADTAPRIGVCNLDQLRHRVGAVANNVARGALGGRDQHAIHDEQSMVVAVHVALDNHRAGDLLRGGERGAHGVVGGEMNRDGAPVIAIVGLHHDRVANAPRRTRGRFFALHQLLLGHGEAELPEDLVGLFLVPREFYGNVRRLARHRGLDTLLEAAVPQLHERVVVEPHPRNATRLSGVHDRRGARSERAALCKADEAVALVVKGPTLGNDAGRARFIGEQRGDEAQRELACFQAFVALFVLVHHVVDAVGTRASRLAKGDRDARDVLQFDGDVFKDVPQPRAVVLGHPADESAGFAIGASVLTEPGERVEEPRHKGGPEATGWPRLKRAQVQREPDDGEVGVERGADIDRPFSDPHSREVRSKSWLPRGSPRRRLGCGG